MKNYILLNKGNYINSIGYGILEGGNILNDKGRVVLLGEGTTIVEIDENIKLPERITLQVDESKTLAQNIFESFFDEDGNSAIYKFIYDPENKQIKYPDKVRQDGDFEEFDCQLKRRQIQYRIKTILDAKAKEKEYDHALSVRSYTGFENTYKIEATKYSKWVSKVWKFIGDEEAKLTKQEIIDCDIEDLLSTMPTFTWE